MRCLALLGDRQPPCLPEDETRWEESLGWLTYRLVTMDRLFRPIVKGLP